MESWKKLKQILWLYKEYFVIAIFGIAFFSWIHIAMGLEKKDDNKIQLLDKKTEQKLINLPPITMFVDLFIEDFNQENFIKKYKRAIKTLNNVKGRLKLKFYFYYDQDMVSSVLINIEYLKDLESLPVHYKQVLNLTKSDTIKKNNVLK